MRELKFRVWNGYLTKEFKAYDRCHVTMDGAYLEIKPYRYDNDYAIEQYTGLKDKNGKEIYEGDILREKGLLSSTCVEWDKNNARYITKVLDRSKYVSATFYFDIIAALECEVIGNIHENPELLEEK